jgi:hypothetical protein
MGEVARRVGVLGPPPLPSGQACFVHGVPLRPTLCCRAGTYPPPEGSGAAPSPPPPESPQTVVWVQLFLAKYHDLMVRHQTTS